MVAEASSDGGGVGGGGEGVAEAAPSSSAAVPAPSDPPAASGANPTFLRGLTVRSPLQKKKKKAKASNGGGANGGGGGAKNEAAVVPDQIVPLPPLRPEEYVSSIRAALGEVAGFAQLTRYRLVVERSDDSAGDDDNDAAEGAKGEGKGASNGAKDGKGGAKNGAAKRDSNPRKQPWSPHTLEGARISVARVDSLVQRRAAADGGEEGKKDARTKEKKEEVILDEYGDLSALLPLLPDFVAGDGTKEEGAAEATAMKEEEAKEEEAEEEAVVIADASSLSLRVILEPYDDASIREQVDRVRALLGGRAPHATSLLGELEESEGEAATEGGERAEGEAAAEGEAEEDPVEDDDKDAPAEEETIESIQEAFRKKRDELSATLPPLPSSASEVLFDSITKGDLSRYYYHACGEEGTLRKLREGTAGGKRANGAKVRELDGSRDDAGKKVSRRKKGKGKRSGGRRSASSDGGSSGDDAPTTNDNANDAKVAPTANGADNAPNAAGVLTPSFPALDPSDPVAVESVLRSLDRATEVDAVVSYSPYHPPPAHRRLLGDLAYLDARTPDGMAVGITAVAAGFYVNRSSYKAEGVNGSANGSSRGRAEFDPAPLEGEGGAVCYSHSLLDCLLRRSPSLRAAWIEALDASAKRAELREALARTEDPWRGLFRTAVVGCEYPSSAGGADMAGRGGGEHVPATDAALARPGWLVPLPPRPTEEDVLDNPVRPDAPRVRTWDHRSMCPSDPYRLEAELRRGGGGGGDAHAGHVGGGEGSAAVAAAGPPRDWNEELQCAREMPGTTFGERIERARLVHKVLCEFGDAALSCVRAVLSGRVLPLNPHEPLRSHVFLVDNIFVSRAVDAGPETFKVVRGDAAARKSAGRDVHNTGVLHRLDAPGLHTLATVLVDYKGQRIVCQSVVPGILHGDKGHDLLYGAVETLSALKCDEEMHKLLEASLGEGCMVATRTVPKHPLTEEVMDVARAWREAEEGAASTALMTKGEDDGDDGNEEGEEKSVRICGPVEMKGIRGSDGRKYVLDCARLTPRDANWVPGEEGGTGRWEARLEEDRERDRRTGRRGGGGKGTAAAVPATLEDDEWTACVLRPELVTAYAEAKIAEYLAERRKAKGKGSGEEDCKAKVNEEKNGTASDPTKTEEEGTGDLGSKTLAEPVSKDGEKDAEEAASAKVEEEYVRSLRYNVNVFLPFARSVEIVDADAHRKLKEDEEKARDLARYLWDVALPALTRDVRSSAAGEGGGDATKPSSLLQLPADGRELTELLHRRGINCRYLGRLAELAREEERRDDAADERAKKAAEEGSGSRTARAPRYGMPRCWLEQLEREMVARAAKRVLDSYLLEHGASSSSSARRVPEAQVLASFLSAMVSTGEESAAETERRLARDEGGDEVLDQEDVGALAFFLEDDDDDDSEEPRPSIRSRDEVWSDVEREVGRRYRYSLAVYNHVDKKDAEGKVCDRAPYAPLLRRICQRSGIRLAARRYELGGKCVTCAGGAGGGGGLAPSHPVAPTDVMDVLPLVRHAASASGETFAPRFFPGTPGAVAAAAAGGDAPPPLHVLLPDARAMYEFAHAHLGSGNAVAAAECALEASRTYRRVVETSLHPQAARCLRLAALARWHVDEADRGPALVDASRYLASAASMWGFDSPEAMHAHLSLAEMLLGAGRAGDAVRHLRAAHFLSEFLGGRNHVGIPALCFRAGTLLYELGRPEDALRFFRAASERRCEDRMYECLVARNAAGVLAQTGRFQEASDFEKRAYKLSVAFLGEDHEQTKSCKNSLVRLMKMALDQERKAAIQEKERVEESAADAMADEIRADEEAGEVVRAKKKKGRSKRKGKK